MLCGLLELAFPMAVTLFHRPAVANAAAGFDWVAWLMNVLNSTSFCVL
jgi:hypothetical protein